MDHEAEAWDDLLFGRGTDEENGYPLKSCNRCGKSALYWKQDNEKRWRLFDYADDTMHSCDTRKINDHRND